jgi:hypothetical protein
MASALLAQALDHAIGQFRSRSHAEARQLREGAAKSRQHPPALRADSRVFLDSQAISLLELIVEVLGEVRVGPSVLAHETAALS